MKEGDNLGLTGFGGSGHIVLKLMKQQYPNSKVFVFSRTERERIFAKELGAVWVGDIGEEAPDKMRAIIDTTPVWKPVVEALKNLEPGGRLVINAIRKEDVDKEFLLNLDYPTQLWMEKEIKSVANVTRNDVIEFLDLASKIPIKPEYEEFDLQGANQALLELKTRKIRGAKVLKIDK
jgi:propanol-preferring alcohol dehydrogenase